VPSWTQLTATARHGEAVLFSFNDLPAMKALSLYREELE
jgi:gentisate 1,2-dioxygenase